MASATCKRTPVPSPRHPIFSSDVSKTERGPITTMSQSGAPGVYPGLSATNPTTNVRASEASILTKSPRKAEAFVEDGDHQPIYITSYKARAPVTPKAQGNDKPVSKSPQPKQVLQQKHQPQDFRSRGVAQDMILAPAASELPSDTKCLIQNWKFPLVRIGELFKVIFKPVAKESTYQDPSSLRSLGAKGQSAVRLATNFQRDGNTHKSRISIQSCYWDPVDRYVKCLRCVQRPAECGCSYDNDLLILSKFDSFTQEPYGHIGITLRIPRDREPPTPEERMRGVTKSNAWLSKLPTSADGTGVRRPKLMMIRVVEEVFGSDDSKPLFSVCSQGYVRLVAKNGCMKEKQQLNAGIQRPIMTNLVQIETAKLLGGPPPQSQSDKWKSPDSYKDILSTPKKQKSSARMNGPRVSSTSKHRLTELSPNYTPRVLFVRIPSDESNSLGSAGAASADYDSESRQQRLAHIELHKRRFQQVQQDQHENNNRKRLKFDETNDDGASSHAEAVAAILTLKGSMPSLKTTDPKMQSGSVMNQANYSPGRTKLKAPRKTKVTSPKVSRRTAHKVNTFERSGLGEHVMTREPLQMPLALEKPSVQSVSTRPMQPGASPSNPTLAGNKTIGFPQRSDMSMFAIKSTSEASRNGDPALTNSPYHAKRVLNPIPASPSSSESEDLKSRIEGMKTPEVASSTDVTSQVGEELRFYMKVKHALGASFNDFLKLLTMFCHEIISRQELVDLVYDMLWGYPELIDGFEKLVGNSVSPMAMAQVAQRRKSVNTSFNIPPLNENPLEEKDIHPPVRPPVSSVH
eukprot:m.339996 g.339996  ORF g.339996 m.339996 type:complete len:802 (+) comp19075_c0_seq1:233-2638(+)